MAKFEFKCYAFFAKTVSLFFECFTYKYFCYVQVYYFNVEYCLSKLFAVIGGASQVVIALNSHCKTLI